MSPQQTDDETTSWFDHLVVAIGNLFAPRPAYKLVQPILRFCIPEELLILSLRHSRKQYSSRVHRDFRITGHHACQKHRTERPPVHFIPWYGLSSPGLWPSARSSHHQHTIAIRSNPRQRSAHTETSRSEQP
jgi:hypothetical protein